MNNRIDPFDELAAMFLTAPQPTAPQPQADIASRSNNRRSARSPGAAAPTELLLVGHLPVRAGLWLVPYADLIAREVGTIGLIRLDAPEPSLQLLRAPEQWASAPARLPLQQAILDLAPCVDMWLIRGSERLQSDEALDCRPDRITILSSADEAAVVSAYQTIKELAQAAEHPHRTLPAIGMAMVGCDGRAADTVIDRLNRTTVSFLGVEVRLVALLPRMDAGIKCTRYMTFDSESSPRVIDVRAWIEQSNRHHESSAAPAAIPPQPPPAQPPLPSEPAVIGRIAPPPETFVHDARRILRTASADGSSRGQEHAESQTPRRPPISDAASAQDRATRQAADGREDLIEAVAQGRPSPQARKLPPKVVVDLEHKPPPSNKAIIEPESSGEPIPLARFVTGLHALPIRPPGHERVELAVDDAGHIHVLARERSFRDLPVVQRWAHVHRELLAMACAQHRFDPAGQTICHVFASEPASLADLHGSDLRLHVLAPVQIGEKITWFAAPLNHAR